jgi:CRISPR-associated endonuclease Csn1
MNATSKIQPSKTTPDLQLAFDVGHSSIGWAVLQSRTGVAPVSNINILGCGSVVFRADDCLASSRRAYRRQRRHIRSTKQRIARMKLVLRQIGALTKKELDQPGCAWPWLLAARVLRGGKLLTWPELWDVLRWYAHNRGYDGNRRWSAAEAEAQKEDSEKEANARSLMGKYGTSSMAETFCAMSGLDPLGKKKSTNLPGDKRPKGQNAAFPREVVESEVRKILQAHADKLKGMDEKLERALLGKDSNDKTAWQEIPCPDLKLPKRYEGGLLFGQLVPRFDNRIISICPVTFAKTYEGKIASGENHDEAVRRALVAAKVPTKKSREFLEYRWAMLLGNIQVAATKNAPTRKLNADERNKVHQQMLAKGFLTATELEKAVMDTSKSEYTNSDATFKVTPDAEEALVLNPVAKYLATNELALLIWPSLPSRLQKRLRGQLRQGKSIRLSKIREILSKPEFGGTTKFFDDAIQKYVSDEALKLALASKKRKGKPADKEKKLPTFEKMLERSLKANLPPGRAPYHRKVLIQAKNEIFAGFDPRKKKQNKLTQTPDRFEMAEEKEADGCLVVTDSMQRISLGRHLTTENTEAEYQAWCQKWLSHPQNKKRYQQAKEHGEEILQQAFDDMRADKWLASQTNNHLVRHRLLILERLLADIIKDKKFAVGDKTRIGKIAIEVARDLLAFSGMAKKDIGSDTKGVLGSIKAQHYRVKDWLEDALKGSQWESAINGKLIWKGKVADDLGRQCPYTGMEIHPADLASGAMDVDHIIPKAQRLTNAMEAVVVTYKQINAMKSARTSWQFINECGGQKVPGTNFELRRLAGPNGFEQFVKNLKTHGSGKAASDGKDGEDSDDKKGRKLNPMYLPGTKKKHPDYIRRKKRKGFLLVKKYDKDKESFTPRDLTVTSHINRLTQQALLKNLPHLGPENIVAIPGTVTGTLRDAKGWRLLGCLQAACGDEVMREITIKDNKTGEPKQIKVVKPKGEIRNITHLHHAVDACALGLMAQFIPKDGKLWELLALKELTDAEKQLWEKSAEEYKWKGYPLTELFTICEITGDDERQSPDPDRKWRLEPKTDDRNRARMNRIKEQIRQHLVEKRVVQHIPADMSGMPTKETVWRVFDSNDAHSNSQRIKKWLIERDVAIPDSGDSTVLITRRKRRGANVDEDSGGKVFHETKTWTWVYDEVAKTKVLGLPDIKGGKLIDDNFGMALYPNAPKGSQFKPIRFFKVWQEIRKLPKTADGKFPEILRRGQIIKFERGRYVGKFWRVLGIEENGKIRFFAPDFTRRVDKPQNHERVMVTSLLRDGIKIVRTPLTGVPCPTTS